MTLDEIVRERIRQCHSDITYSLHEIRNNNPYGGEPSYERVKRRMQRKMHLTPSDAKFLSAQVRRQSSQRGVAAEAYTAEAGVDAELARGRAEAIWGDTVDFVSVAFLEIGARKARSVGRVAFKSGQPNGTGVLIGSDLFLTNNHVIDSPAKAEQCLLEFDYERGLTGAVREPTRFRIDPSLFITHPINGLDYTVFAVGAKWDGPEVLVAYGNAPLSDAGDKHMIGEFANIIQHPRGRFKEVVLRENRLVNRFDDALHYLADTERGSSGSPVFNSEWQMIALHHWGGPWIDGDDVDDPSSFEINEGIRISSIVRNLRTQMRSLPAFQQERLASALNAEGIGASPSSTARNTPAPQSGSRVEVAEDGTATWTVPLEVSVRIPALAGQPAPEPTATTPQASSPTAESDSFSDRRGYLPDFIPGFHVPLPQLGPGLRDDAAPLLDPVPGANPFELKYHHFSVVTNKRRRLAFFTACMIDGKTAKSIGRSSRNISDLQATDRGLAETVAGLDGAEADSWSTDNRIDRSHYSGDEIYKKQKVPGFPNPRSKDRIARMFQKGHLVRRLDPAWGDDNRALAAELDTFFWTNAAPQVGFFNQGTADEEQPGTGKGNLWRAAENYVLRNAVAEDQRVVSFTGPVFSDDDRPFRHIRIPGKFFKITVWAENGQLRSLALLVDQSQVFDAWPESFGTQEFLDTATEAEAFLDANELSRVQEFLSTIEEIEDLTELNFGTAVRAADVRKGQGSAVVETDDDLPLNDGTPMTAIPGALDVPDGTEDDLTRIRGIGASLKRLLNANGIFHFHQIAVWGDAEIEIVSNLLRFPGRIEGDNWVGQAQALEN
ncbi:DNA/RNA non-specific endonuclease [Rhodobacteraceae bacterium B1Z28]|uniref:Serine protease n=1 Tax=Ruegeria haliotis TaxID=2747601 RepID=A0ABX2PYQ9_9RHOB|nr:DNA/RNA non-specific endonuclease [Ruegeria haliotis]NVO58202.1 DNA/RNA non-specific endonuclease [Ruegeria haliotis]